MITDFPAKQHWIKKRFTGRLSIGGRQAKDIDILELLLSTHMELLLTMVTTTNNTVA